MKLACQKSAIAKFLAMVVLWYAAPAPAISCSVPLAGIVAKFRRPKPFSEVAARQALEGYEKQLSRGEVKGEPPRTLEEKLAFFEAVLHHSTGHKGMDLIGAMGFSGRKRAIGKTIGRIKLEKGISEAQLNRLLEAIFLSRHLKPDTIRSLRRNGWTGSVENRLRSFFDGELASRGILEILERMNLKKANSLWEKTMRASEALMPLSESVFTVLGASPLLSLGAPLYLPAVRTLSRKAKKRVHATVQQYGIDAAYQDFKQVYGASAKFEVGWSLFRGLYLKGVLLALVAGAIQEGRQQLATVAAEEEDAREEITALGEKYENQDPTLTAWKRNYERDHGHAPSKEEEAFIQAVLTPH
jgi:hypothetical protein